MNSVDIEVKLLSNNAKLPEKTYSKDAAYDLYSAEDAFVGVNSTIKINTDIAINIPEGYFGKIEARSGMASKGLNILGGVVDAQYLGPICVVLQNQFYFNPNTAVNGYHVKKGDRIAQIVIHDIPRTYLRQVQEFTVSTERDTNGFNSSGR